ncbi:MAG TPA: hypothetical protein VER11_02110 [Polyangiaceae bacterium]|nr:hypothetical protein [Polyangiaceae bacterium]
MLATMIRLMLTIEGECCGPMSIGTVAVIRALQKHLGLSLAESSECVERCVFEGEQVTLSAPTRAAAHALLAEFERLPAAARIHAHLAD